MGGRAEGRIITETHKDKHTDVISRFSTVADWAAALWCLAGLGKSSVPCTSPSEFREKVASRTSAKHSQAKLRIAAISHDSGTGLFNSSYCLQKSYHRVIIMGFV